MTSIKDIQRLVTQARLGAALEKARLLAQALGDDSLDNTLTLLSSRYNQNENNNGLGLVSSSDYQMTRNQITHGLLNVLGNLEDQLPAEGIEVGEPSPEPVTSAPTPTPPSSPADALPADDGITRILFLASNPSETAKLKLREEHSRVSQRLQEALEPEKFPLNLKQAVTPSEFNEYLYTVKPDIVHFSGHGDRTQPDVVEVISTRAGRDEEDEQVQSEEESGIFLYDENKRNAHFVGTTFLKRTFRTMVQRNRIPIRAVIFNACHSEKQAKAISEIVPYVVGTSWTVGDDAAIAFATGFYFGIAQGMDIEGAVDFGINNALAYNEPEDRFILYKDGEKVVW